MAMDKSPDPVAAGPVKVRTADGHGGRGPGTALAGRRRAASRRRRPSRWPGSPPTAAWCWPTALSPASSRPSPRCARTSATRPALATVFEDFEKKNYEGWTITGDAFGKGPSRGTEAGQQPVSGFAGRGLVNTFIAGDGPQGTATSKPFRIERRYIGFLIGGGSHRGPDVHQPAGRRQGRPHRHRQEPRGPGAGQLGRGRPEGQGGGDRDRRPAAPAAGATSTSTRSSSPTSRPSRCLKQGHGRRDGGQGPRAAVHRGRRGDAGGRAEASC